MGRAVFYVNGVAQGSAKCGDSLVFDIPGYQNIWMTQYQNGALQYDGPQALPTQPLLLTCPPDEGVFQGTAFEMINGQKGAQVDSWTFNILNVGSTSPPPTTTPVNTGGQQSCTTGLCTSATPAGGTGTGGGGSPQVIPTPITTGGGSPGGAGTTPPSGGGLSPFGDLPGSIPAATTGTGGPGQGQSGAQPTATTTQAFSFSGFVQNPLFWLLLVVLALVYFMGD